MPQANDLRKGRVIRYNGEPQLVMEVTHRTPGNLRAFVQAKLRNLKSGRSGEVRFSSTEAVEVLETDSKEVEFSYKNMDVYSFMDLETYETFELSDAIVGSAKDYLAPNAKAKILFVDGKPVEVEVPSSVELTVTEAPDAIKGDTATGATKSVVLETGIRVSAPLFVKTGDRLRISTAEGSYLGRA
ncbi:MAG TPA: elongation factor P [Opitutales bacterium]|nr:elongation factor P [Opitutales bacterium]